MKKSPLVPLKQFMNLIQARIPQHLRIVAEIRLMWTEIVGERLAESTHVAKCEYLPIKDASGNSTGQYSRRLLIWVQDPSVRMAVTELADEFLERIPNRFRIHSLKVQLVTFQQINKPIKKQAPPPPKIEISDKEKDQINKRLDALSINDELKQSLYQFLVICKSQKNRTQ